MPALLSEDSKEAALALRTESQKQKAYCINLQQENLESDCDDMTVPNVSPLPLPVDMVQETKGFFND